MGRLLQRLSPLRLSPKANKVILISAPCFMSIKVLSNQHPSLLLVVLTLWRKIEKERMEGEGKWVREREKKRYREREGLIILIDKKIYCTKLEAFQYRLNILPVIYFRRASGNLSPTPEDKVNLLLWFQKVTLWIMLFNERENLIFFGASNFKNPYICILSVDNGDELSEYWWYWQVWWGWC